MLRETTFVLGGYLVVALGSVLLLGLFLSGAGAAFFSGWLAGAASVGFGLFFLHVGRAEGRARRRALRTLESEGTRAPPPPPV
jgi:hypothetical protein